MMEIKIVGGCKIKQALNPQFLINLQDYRHKILDFILISILVRD